MAGLQDIEWEECFIEPHKDAELEREYREATGLVSPANRYFTACPWVVRSFIAFQPRRIGLVYTSFDLADLISLVVSQDNSCRFCYAATRVGMRLIGIPEKRIRQLEQDLYSAAADAPTKAALEFVRHVSRANPLPSAADRHALREAGFEDLAIKEIAFLAAVNIYFNRAMTLPAIPIDRIEELPQRWFFPLLRPVAGRRFRSHERRGHLQPLAEQTLTGPYSYLSAALGGLPAAAALRGVFEGAWNSPVLSRRTKAIVFAIIARGLGCSPSEREASGILLEEGFADDEVEELLSRLGGARLSEAEAAIAPFARETIWYRPAQIQRRARALRAQLSNEEFIELVGIASLANGACRLGAAICEDRRD